MRAEYPILYQLNTRLWLWSRSGDPMKPATLADITEDELQTWVEAGYRWIYLLGVWQTGEYGRVEALNHPGLQAEYRAALPDFDARDVCGSPFAITAYQPADWVGGEPALADFRARLHRRGLRLMLDFVANHTAVDHPWAHSSPGWFIAGGPDDLLRAEKTHIRVNTAHGERVLAHGRDPYFPPWTDTLQLNYSDPELQRQMTAELLRAASFCDGLRCDMAMLLLPDVYERSWGVRIDPFWPQAIARLRQAQPEFTLLAEVYWGLDWTLQQQGFDFTYDKTLYDRLLSGSAEAVRGHLQAEPAYRDRLARFLENHDEARAAARFSPPMHRAAALITYLTPGLRFFHQGQLSGLQRRIPVQLCRSPVEPPEVEIERFYRDLLALLRRPIFHMGSWRLLDLDPRPSRPGPEALIAWTWNAPDQNAILIVVNYSADPASGGLPAGQIAAAGSAGFPEVLLTSSGCDLSMSSRDGFTAVDVELPAWGFCVAEYARMQR